MAEVATLHIRNVPDEVVAVLKGRADGTGRSLNSEVVETLSDATRRERVDEILASIDKIRSRIKKLPAPEQLDEEIRRARDERADHLWRVATRPRDPDR
jgi:plasmid stability protein